MAIYAQVIQLGNKSLTLGDLCQCWRQYWRCQLSTLALSQLRKPGTSPLTLLEIIEFWSHLGTLPPLSLVVHMIHSVSPFSNSLTRSMLQYKPRTFDDSSALSATSWITYPVCVLSLATGGCTNKNSLNSLVVSGAPSS